MKISYLAVGEPDSKGVCHPLRGPVLDWIFCQEFDFPRQFARSREKVAFSIPSSWAEHGQGLANPLPSVTTISLSCSASKALLSQPNLFLISGALSRSPRLLNPAQSSSAEGAGLSQRDGFFTTGCGFSWIQCTCHSVHQCQAAAFTPNTSRSHVLCFLFNIENQYILYCPFFIFIKSLNFVWNFPWGNEFENSKCE